MPSLSAIAVAVAGTVRIGFRGSAGGGDAVAGLLGRRRESVVELLGRRRESVVELLGRRRESVVELLGRRRELVDRLDYWPARGSAAEVGRRVEAGREVEAGPGEVSLRAGNGTALAARRGRPTDGVAVDRDAGARLRDGWIGPFLKMEPASASGPGPAATVLVPPKKLNAAFKLLPGPPTDSAIVVADNVPRPIAKFRLLPADRGQVLPLPRNWWPSLNTRLST